MHKKYLNSFTPIFLYINTLKVTLQLRNNYLYKYTINMNRS